MNIPTLIEIIEDNWTSLHNPAYTDEALGEALDKIIEIVNKAEERPHGEWIEHHSGGEITFICSECKNIIDVDYEDFEKGEFKYCDMCGAKMTHPKPH